MMEPTERKARRLGKAMTRAEVIVGAAEGKIRWIDAAKILRVTPRHLRRLREVYEDRGTEGLEDGRNGSRRKRVKPKTVEDVLRLRREKYAEFSVKHFHEMLFEKHKLRISYTWTKQLLQAAGLADRAAGRGKYRRKRERRPMRGMMLHLDGSTHEWVRGQPMRDLILVLDDADGKALWGKFVEQEGTMSTMEAIDAVVRKYGRFCELYTDRGSHFCRTSRAGEGPDEQQDGHVTQALKALGIDQILARSPQARGRSERAFGTIQGRLPQELRAEGIDNYYDANEYLQRVFLPDFSRRFSVKPTEAESAFLPVIGIDLELVLSVQHERRARADNTVSFERVLLQLPRGPGGAHYARCPVTVHEVINGDLVVSRGGKRLARFNRQGDLLPMRRAAA